MLIFPLKREWYEKIRSGEKRIEYREIKPYWTTRLRKVFKTVYTNERDIFSYAWCDYCPCILRLGYTKRQMTADITKIEVVDGKDTDLRVDKPVYAIHLTNVRDIE